MTLTAEYVRSRLDYDPVAGTLTWKPREVVHYRDKIWNTRFAGKVAGTEHSEGGAIKIGLEGKTHYAHRIAWLIAHGEWPADQLDHKNRSKNTNAIENLRECDTSQNRSNVDLSKVNTSGVKGVCWHKRIGKWQVAIKIKQKTIHIGYFSDIDEAAKAYASAAERYFGEFAYPARANT